MSKTNGVNDTTGEPYWKRRRKANRERVRAVERNSYLKAQYGITLEQYEDMYDEQCGCCKTCGLVLAYDKNVSVDHCHKTNKVRGILCGRCNKALGLIGDSTRTLKEMITYLS